MTAGLPTLVEAYQGRHQGPVGVHGPRGASRRSTTCGSSWWRAKTGSAASLLILVRKTHKWFTHLCHFSPYLIYTTRSLHQEQEFPPVQVVEGWEEDGVHRGGGQRVSRRTREGRFCRGERVFGFLNLQCEVRSHFFQVPLFWSVTCFWTVCILSFTGQRILTWEGPETKEPGSSGAHRQQAADTNGGDLYLTICPCIFQYSIFNRFPPTHTRLLPTELLSGSMSSPHQEVDNFVLTLVRKDGIQGSKCPVVSRLWLF